MSMTPASMAFPRRLSANGVRKYSGKRVRISICMDAPFRSELEQAFRRIEDDPAGVAIDRNDDRANEGDGHRLGATRVEEQHRAPGRPRDLDGLSELVPGRVLAAPAFDLVRVEVVVGNGGRRLVGNHEVAARERPRGFAVVDAVEADEETIRVGTHRRDHERPLLPPADPGEAGTGDE